LRGGSVFRVLRVFRGQCFLHLSAEQQPRVRRVRKDRPERREDLRQPLFRRQPAEHAEHDRVRRDSAFRADARPRGRLPGRRAAAPPCRPPVTSSPCPSLTDTIRSSHAAREPSACTSWELAVWELAAWKLAAWELAAWKLAAWKLGVDRRSTSSCRVASPCTA